MVDDLLMCGAGASERTVMWEELLLLEFLPRNEILQVFVYVSICNSTGDVEVSTELGIMPRIAAIH